MEFKILILFAVLAVAQATDDSLLHSASYQQTTIDSTIEESNDACYNGNNEVGECVQSYLCDRATSTIIEDGSDVIDVRSQRDSSCVAPMVCCKSKNDKAPETSYKSFPMATRQQQQGLTRRGCGWRNENGVKNVTGNIPEGYAKPGEFPWTVSIIRAKRAEGKSRIAYSYVGGGLLIHEKVALTAAHVVASEQYPTQLYVSVGNYDGTQLLPKVLKIVESLEIHEQYMNDTFLNDLALVITKYPIAWMPNMGYICLPPLNAPVTPGSMCFASGWGKDASGIHQFIMGKVEMPVLTRDACQTSLRTTDVGPFFELDQSFMCAGGEKDVDTCKGSGGSPLACPIAGQPGRYMASGVLSWGMSCGLDGQPSVYIDVARARQWIDDKMKQRGFSIASYSEY